MNNSQLIVEDFPDEENDVSSKLRSEELRIIKIIEALREIQEQKAWQTLKAELFDNLANLLEKGLLTEAKSEEADERKLNRLAGELKWAERYSDMSKLENNYKVQLQNIRTKLYGERERA